MEFPHITPKDAGRYYCTAENVHGNVTKVAEVIVNRNDVVSNQQNAGRTQEVIEGETVSLNCNAPNEDPQPGAQVNYNFYILYNFQHYFRRPTN